MIATAEVSRICRSLSDRWFVRETVCWTNADKEESIASFEMLAGVDVRVRVDGGEGETLNDESSIESMAEKEANIAVS